MVNGHDDADAFLDQLTDKLKAPHCDLVNHPAIEDMVAGKLTREQVRGMLSQQYLFSRIVPKLLCLRYSQVTDPEVLARLQEVMDEELAGKQTGTEDHVKLHQRACLALGMSLSELESPHPNPETRAVIYWQELAVRSRPWFLALGMKYGDEGQFAACCARMGPALQTHYGLTAEDVVFFSAHVEADADHRQFFRKIIREYAATPNLRAEFEAMTLTTAEVWWDMWYAGAYRELRERRS
jgi:pyrroloquinoline quinone (PQQ) biosynthesis protein C